MNGNKEDSPLVTEASSRAAGPVEVVLAYHERTKHRLDRYAAGPETLDWTMQPDSFREFSGSPRIPLPLSGRSLTTSFADIYAPGSTAPLPLSIESVGALMELSMGLSAWKVYGPDRWALRCNPSSGNLHPTEAYLLCRRVPGLENGLYHYVSRDHVLEQRCRIAAADGAVEGDEALARLWIGLSSVHWREAWKYGERAFRYCQHDAGHALGALRYAAGVLGWTMSLVDSCSDRELARLLGLDRDENFATAEREEPDLLLTVNPCPSSNCPLDKSNESAAREPAQSHWTGRANVLDPRPMYRWPVIDEVANATRKECVDPEMGYRGNYPPLVHSSAEPTARVILKRRSAQRFDGRSTMSAADFFHILDCLLPRPVVPWDVWHYAPCIHPVFFIHRVEGLKPGLYVLLRRPEAEAQLRRALRPDFLWQRTENAPAHLPFFQLIAADCRKAARTLSCHQAIAADGCFSLGMLSEFEEIVRTNPWRYRQLHWEAGLLGQVLYLEAEAAGLRGTGIGCYFDDAVHEILGLGDRSFQSLYHFTVGHALTDERIATLPPYDERARFLQKEQT